MLAAFDRFVQQHAPQLPLLVAYSGGADSTALLLACAERWPGQVYAVHIHHGLQDAADAFASHCERFCQRLQVPLQVRAVQARHAQGDSPENAARIARYKEISDVILTGFENIAIKTVAIAQHADDQVETMLLALSRGAGLPGLAAMPQRWRRDGIDWCRPLLRVSAPDIRQWLAQRGLVAGQDWVEDPTNSDQSFTRNRIRAQLLPALNQCFPAWRDTFARSAQHAAQAQTLLDELAQQDLQAAQKEGGLLLAQVQNLSRPRQANLLRAWVVRHGVLAPASAQLEELLQQIAACTTRGHQIRIKVASGYVLRERERLVFSR